MQTTMLEDAEAAGHRVTDTGYCAQGCPVCIEEDRVIMERIREIESREVEGIDWRTLDEYLRGK